ncbi:MAG: NAD kinase, partial [Boseongicola sp. SB0662_bin_57]|nr:NAD kinase [Boseongicola sp. SB0662_bin_57]
MRSERAVSFRASEAEVAQEALTDLTGRFGQSTPDEADVIVALGGDGFMLDTLKDVQPLDKPVYGM